MGALTAKITNISNNNEEMRSGYHLMYIDVIKEVNKIPTAQLVVLDGNAAKQEFKISSDKFFEPGQEIKIQLRYDNNSDETIFEGIIVRHRIKADKNGSYLTIDLKDKLFKLTTQRKSRVFKGQNGEIKDSEIIGKILSDNGIDDNSITVKDTTYGHREVVQHYCTDWDFMVSRVEKNGHWLLIEDGGIFTEFPGKRNDQKHVFNYNKSIIYDFEMEVDIRHFHTYSQIKSTAWDISKQELNSFQDLDEEFHIDQGSELYDPVSWLRKLEIEQFQLVSPINLSEDEIGAWAVAEEVKSLLSVIKGHIKVPGNAAIKPGDLIEIKGIGDRFNGIIIATGVRHQVSENGWQTDVQFGLSGDWFSQRNDIVDTPAAGLLPAINGLHIGIVESSEEEDPEGHYRIKVRVPAFSTHDQENNGVVWARLASLYAGDNRGVLFQPEVGDEVVVGFFNDDPRQAVILGAMHSSKNQPPEQFRSNDQNDLKGFVTRGGIYLGFSEEEGKAAFKITTPGGQTLSLNDGIERMSMADKHGNAIVMNKDGIRITSKKDVAIKARESGFSANTLRS